MSNMLNVDQSRLHLINAKLKEKRGKRVKEDDARIKIIRLKKEKMVTPLSNKELISQIESPSQEFHNTIPSTKNMRIIRLKKDEIIPSPLNPIFQGGYEESPDDLDDPTIPIDRTMRIIRLKKNSPREQKSPKEQSKKVPMLQYFFLRI